MNPYQNNFNYSNKNRSNMYNNNPDQQNSSNKSNRNHNSRFSNIDDDKEEIGFPSRNRDSSYKDFNTDRNQKSSTTNKGEFYDYEFDLVNEKSSNYKRTTNNQFITSQRENRKFTDDRNKNLSIRNTNPAFTRNNRKNSDDELEIKMPFESFGNKRRSYQLEKSNYANPRNVGMPTAGFNEASQAIPEQKVNYRLQKKVKKGEVDDEVEIINSYAKENCRFLPIEEYCM